MSDEYTKSDKSIFGWKGVIIAIVFAVLFLGFLFLSISQEPDYMPSQKRKQAAEAAAQQTATDAKMANATTLESNTEMAMPEGNSTDGTTTEMNHTEQHAH
ncbi:hypothetical protein MKI79_07195 [Acinetobacter sp. A3.8]|uniref:DUF4199 domain-containing protein n=1 Tax=Acinetobacter sedimenti TaxID=2919922 RepID=A0A9X1WWY1_9GAMM|nr:hypothetical protein [Acinetobacter sedimenti]MCJ8146684.1 hypothetical protein [Acinetobacter sedimenti]